MGKSTEMVINDYYKELPTYKKVIFREKVCSSLEVSKSRFYRGLRKDDWRKIEKEAIEKIIELGFDA